MKPVLDNSSLDKFLSKAKCGQTCGSCVMHSYWFVLNYYSALEEINNPVTFDNLNRIYLLWINCRMDISAQQEKLRFFLNERQNTDAFRCKSYHKIMNAFLSGSDLPSIDKLDSFDKRDLELFQTIVFHYYCQKYVVDNLDLFDNYRNYYPDLCDNGIRGYLNIYEFNEFLESSEGKEYIFRYSNKLPDNYRLIIPEIHEVCQSEIKDYLNSRNSASMVLYDNHSRVIFDHNSTKSVYDSRKESYLAQSHILGVNEYFVKSPINSKSKTLSIEYLYAQPKMI